MEKKECTRRDIHLLDELLHFLFEDESDRKGRDT